MIQIVNTGKYYSCLSCGCDAPELLRTFKIGRRDNIKHQITLCTKCLGKLVKQEVLYQPKEDNND